MTDNAALVTRDNQAVAPSITLYTESSLARMLPPALKSDVDAVSFSMPVIPPTVSRTELLPHLRKAAFAHEAALCPASRDEIRRQLAILSTATIPWNQEEREAKMQLEIITNGLSDVPLDVLKDGVRAYMIKEGRRYFPRSPGELREFVAPILNRRKRRAANLARMVAELEREVEEAKRHEVEATSWTQAKVDKANETFAQCGLRTRYRLEPGGRVSNFMLTDVAA